MSTPHPDCMSVVGCEKVCEYCSSYKQLIMSENKVVGEAIRILLDRGWVLLPPPNSELDILKK